MLHGVLKAFVAWMSPFAAVCREEECDGLTRSRERPAKPWIEVAIHGLDSAGRSLERVSWISFQ